MGAMKELMIEMWNERPTHMEVSFLCPICGHPAAAFLDVPSGEDKYIEEVPCLNNESEHEWTVVVTKGPDGYSAFVEERRDVDVSLTIHDTDDEWDEPLPEPGAYGIFFNSLNEWRNNVSRLSVPDGASSVNRMLFSTLYSVVEAYLADRIVGAVLSDISLQRKMLDLDGLRDRKVSLKSVLDKPNIVFEEIRTTLQAISFHNLTLVNWICETAFGKPFLPKDHEDRALIVKSVNKRHDCVHRNGFDRDGNKHTDITQDYLLKLEAIFRGMAEALEDAIQNAVARRFLEDLDVAEGRGG